MKTVFEIMDDNAEVLRSLARTGVAIEDVNNLEMYREFEQLLRDGLKTTYIIAHLCDEYAVCERTVWRIVRKFRRIVNGS